MTKIILDAIRDGQSPKEISKLYAQAYKEKRPVNWEEINKAIVDKWDFEKLEEIKQMAWDIIGR